MFTTSQKLVPLKRHCLRVNERKAESIKHVESISIYYKYDTSNGGDAPFLTKGHLRYLTFDGTTGCAQNSDPAHC